MGRINPRSVLSIYLRTVLACNNNNDDNSNNNNNNGNNNNNISGT